MNYGYIRVSTDIQTVENQKLAITQWCETRQIKVDFWISETISGAVSPEERKLGNLLNSLTKYDCLIVTEISRLGRSLTMIFQEMQVLLDKGVKLYAIKENFVLADDIQSKVLAFAFGLSAEIERKLISERTKLRLYLQQGKSVYFISKTYKVKWQTAKRFIKECLDMDKPAPLTERPKKHGHPSKAEMQYFETHQD